MSIGPMDPNPAVTVRNQSGHLIVQISAPAVNQREAQAIRMEVLPGITVAGRGRCFVLDLSAVQVLTSMGLGMCVELRNRASDAGYKPVVVGLNNHLTDLFALMRVDRLFTVAATRAELEALLG